MKLIAALVAAITICLSACQSVPETVLFRAQRNAPVSETPVVDYAAAYVYFLHTLPPDQQIRIVFEGTPVVDRMLYIASRESMGDTTQPYTYDCAADNLGSSAAGLFQTLAKYHKARAERLGLSWSDVAGPDCYADVQLAFDLWREQGLSPWKVR